MSIDLNLLPVFVALMEERNVTRAAERLSMTQPALSNALRRLRDALGDSLFIRERYGIRATERAQELFPAIAAALCEIDSTLARRVFDPLTDVRSFTLAANPYAEYVLVPRLVERVHRLAPGLNLRIVPFGGELVETGAITGGTAMALGRIVDPPESLVVQKLMEDDLACVVRADHPEVGDALTRSAYERMRHVAVLPVGRLRIGLRQILEKYGIKRDVAVSVSHFLAVPELIAGTDYCATLPGMICRRLASDPRLRVVAAPIDLGAFPVHVGWHNRYRNDAAHHWLRNQLKEMAFEIRGGDLVQGTDPVRRTRASSPA
jgi:DNA-binding transcriptional LysR family regulator